MSNTDMQNMIDGRLRGAVACDGKRLLSLLPLRGAACCVELGPERSTQ